LLLKRAINQGAKKFGAILNREWRVSQATFSLVADQQYYQMPEDAIRPKALTVTIGSVTYPLTEIPTLDGWHDLNRTVSTSTVPSHYFIGGSDEFGIWPVPAENQSSAATLVYERRMRDMAQANYTTGTVSITAGTAAVVGVGTTFTASMVGRYLSITDGSADGMWYKLAGFVDSTNLTLENNYGGTTASGAAFAIGEIPDIPEEYHESLIDYACYRYYRRRRDIQLARDMKSAFDESLIECRSNYSSKTTSQYFRAARSRPGLGRDLTVTGS
jgi:hypothetical protein